MQQPSTNWFHVVNWLAVVGGLNVISIMAGSVWFALYLVTLLLNVILGSVGIYCEMKMAERVWPNAIVILILVMLTPGGFYNLKPWPLLMMFANLSHSTTHINIAVGITIILALGVVTAWCLVTCTTQFACWFDKATNHSLRYFIPLPLFLALLVIYNLIIAGVLRTMCYWGLYSDMSVFSRIS